MLTTTVHVLTSTPIENPNVEGEYVYQTSQFAQERSF